MTEKIFSGLHPIVKGRGSGLALATSQAINFLSSVDGETGIVTDPNHELYGKSLKGRVLIFPKATGSSVGAYVLYSLAMYGASPSAIVCQSPDITTASGCAIARIPLVALTEASELAAASEDTLLDVDASNGQIIAKV